MTELPDVTADGQRFLMVKPRTEEEGREVVVVLNWSEELKQRRESNGRLRSPSSASSWKAW